jgi:putative PIN family toxin of toxin-antitoxin system
MLVVLDTNILISALISPAGSANKIYSAWKNSRFALLTHEKQINEFRRVTRYPKLHKYILPEEAGTMINEVMRLAIHVKKLKKIDVSPDSNDNFLLEIAVAGGADYLVSGDNVGLLQLKKYEGTKIIGTKQFLNLLLK